MLLYLEILSITLITAWDLFHPPPPRSLSLSLSLSLSVSVHQCHVRAWVPLTGLSPVVLETYLPIPPLSLSTHLPLNLSRRQLLQLPALHHERPLMCRRCLLGLMLGSRAATTPAGLCESFKEHNSPKMESLLPITCLLLILYSKLLLNDFITSYYSFITSLLRPITSYYFQLFWLNWSFGAHYYIITTSLLHKSIYYFYYFHIYGFITTHYCIYISISTITTALLPHHYINIYITSITTKTFSLLPITFITKQWHSYLHYSPGM